MYSNAINKNTTHENKGIKERDIISLNQQIVYTRSWNKYHKLRTFRHDNDVHEMLKQSFCENVSHQIATAQVYLSTQLIQHNL